jgi:hypothetical protein
MVESVAVMAVTEMVKVGMEVVMAEVCLLQLGYCCRLQSRLQMILAVLLHPVMLHSTALQGWSRCCCTARRQQVQGT